MDLAEAGSLLAAVRVELAGGEVAELTRRTEGWPVALYLAALSIKARPAGRRGRVQRAGWVAGRLPAVGAAGGPVTGRGPVPDPDLGAGAAVGAAVRRGAGTTGSAAVLASLERANLLVVPLDRQREWYRYHQLFRELLRGQLERDAPELVRELTLRAAQWCEGHGLAEAAIGYAMDAGDGDLVARGVEQAAIGVYRSGRLVTVQRWFDWFEDHGLIAPVSRGGHARGLDPGARRPRGHRRAVG